MNAVTQSRTRRHARSIRSLSTLSVVVAMLSLGAPAAHADHDHGPTVVKVDLSEWKVQATPGKVPPGPVEFEVTNGGTIPHALEIEGRGVEQDTPQIRPGSSATLKLELRSGNYELYCPVGKGSHRMLGMMSRLAVGKAERAATTSAKGEATDEAYGGEKGYAGGKDDDDDRGGYEHGGMHGDMHGEMHGGQPDHDQDGAGAKQVKVAGGGTVIQILPGPFPFADSAMAVIQGRPPDQQADLTKKAHMGPYSNNVVKIAGDISLVAIDRGASGDSVSGTASFTAQDGARWKVVMDRVQTKDIPFNPRFGGVITGLFYHGASGVHTPLVPTIQSTLALWAYAHLYRNDQLVTNDAMVHVMLLSRTRRPGDWALDCWDCSDRPIEEVQLQVTPAPNTPAFDSPGGFLFVNWEKSSGERTSL
jgi:hypothetical protein